MPNRRQFLRGVAAGASAGFAGCSGFTGGTGTSTPTGVPTFTPVGGAADDVAFEEFVDTDGSEFVVGGEPTVFSGGNHPQLSRLDGGLAPADWLDVWLDLVPDLNVLRVPAFGEGEPNYLQPEPGEYNERAFRLLDRVLYRFGERGVRLVLPLANYWDWRGGIPQYVAWSDSAESKADFYTDDQCQQWFRDFVAHVLERENAITGIQYKDDPTVAVWELANEPRAGDAGYAAYSEWVRSTSEFVKSLDGNHLVSTGMEGFYGYDGPVGHDDSRYVETHRIDAVDACSFHLYPETWGLSIERGNEWIRSHTRDAHERVGKPGYLGEFGVEVDRTDTVADAEELRERNRAYESWYETLAKEGTDGAMVWDLRTDSEYEWTHTWNRHAVYPRDEGTVEVIDAATEKLTGEDGSGS